VKCERTTPAIAYSPYKNIASALAKDATNVADNNVYELVDSLSWMGFQKLLETALEVRRPWVQRIPFEHVWDYDDILQEWQLVLEESSQRDRRGKLTLLSAIWSAILRKFLNRHPSMSDTMRITRRVEPVPLSLGGRDVLLSEIDIRDDEVPSERLRDEELSKAGTNVEWAPPCALGVRRNV
jgi:hypothetical protein